MLKIFILYSIITFLFNFVITTVFSYNKTIYTILTAAIIFILMSFYLLYLGFEFLALSFFMTYVGGIVVMFLFLVLVLEVANENSKSSTKYLIKSSFYISVCGSVLTILFSAVFIYLFNYEIFNDIDFWNILTNYYYSYEEINSYLLPDFDVNIVLPFYNYSFIINPTDFFHFDWSNLQAFYADTFILGIYIYVENSAYLYTIAFFLFLATIIACSISLTKIKSLK